MSSSTLYRLSGLGLLIGSVFSITGTLVRTFQLNPLSVFYTPAELLTLFAALLALLSLPGIYLRQANRAGVIGLIGFVLLYAATVILGASSSLVSAILVPFLAQHAPTLGQPPAMFFVFIIAVLASTVGQILFGIATLRAHIFPRGAAILLLVGTAVNFASGFVPIPSLGLVGEAAFLLSFAWLGLFLVTERAAEVPTLQTDTKAEMRV